MNLFGRYHRQLAVFGAAAVALICAAAAFGAGSASRATRHMTLACYAGDIQTTMEKYILPDFEKQYNVSISYLPGISAASIAKLQAEKSHPQIDAACLDDGPAAKARSFGLLQPFDMKQLTNVKQVAKFARLPGNVGVGWGVLGIGIVYSPKAYQQAGIKPPTSWNDLANPKLKGHVVVDTIASVYGTALLDMLAYANGGSETNIGPGFTAMKKVRPNVLTFDTTADMSPYLEQGGAWAAVWTDAETNAFIGRSHFDAKFVYPKEGSPVDMTTIGVVKGAPNADLANELANYLISKKAQYLVATKLGLAPSNTGVKLPKALQKKMPYGPKAMAKLRQMNWKVINAKLPAWTDRWNREIEH